MKENDLQVLSQTNGQLRRDDEDHFTFIEDGATDAAEEQQQKQTIRPLAAPKAHIDHPELKWRPVAGSLHGKLSVNANGAMLIMYLRHEDYNNSGLQLADALASEVEQIGEVLAETDMEKEVAKCY